MYFLVPYFFTVRHFLDTAPYYCIMKKNAYFCNYQTINTMDIQSAVCSFYGEEEKNLVAQSRKRRSNNITECLHFIIYLLHYHSGHSIKTIAERYGMSRRNVSYIVSKMKWGIENQPYYAKIYEQIKKEVSECTDTSRQKERI